jgi:hypothetical protein
MAMASGELRRWDITRESAPSMEKEMQPWEGRAAETTPGEGVTDMVNLDYDEGSWYLTFDLHDANITVVLDDQEAFELDDALAAVRRRKEEYEDNRQLYRGMRQAGFFEPPEA